MIAENQSILGLNLDSRHDRRLFVLFYCGLFLLLLTLGIFWSHYIFLFGILQSVTLAGGLGGIRGGGPVKSFTGREHGPGDLSRTISTFPVQTLNLDAHLPSERSLLRLDERETAERDRAHLTAFRLLRWTAVPLCLTLALSLSGNLPFHPSLGPAIVWTVVMLILTLPQLVILWTEPSILD